MNAVELKSLARYIVDEMQSRGLIEDKYMTIDMVAEMLHMPVSTIYQSKMPRRKKGKRLVFLMSEVRKWIDER